MLAFSFSLAKKNPNLMKMEIFLILFLYLVVEQTLRKSNARPVQLLEINFEKLDSSRP